jgi:hypothetical protein
MLNAELNPCRPAPRKENIMTSEEAIILYESEFWKHLSFRERAEFQLFEDKLCMPFGIFHEAVEKTLERAVYTHEFGLNCAGLQMEVLGEKSPPTLQEILELIPEEKRMIIQLPDAE